jgi:hypothetical protein
VTAYRVLLTVIAAAVSVFGLWFIAALLIGGLAALRDRLRGGRR